MTDFNTARSLVGGLKGVMQKLGDAPEHDHKWNGMPRCPFCQNRDCAGVFNREGTDFFKCHHSSCCTGGEVLTEVSYIARRLGLSDQKPPGGGASPAYQRFLELAGCWESPAPKSSTTAEPNVPESKPEPHEADSTPLDAELVGKAIEVIRNEQKASARMLQRRLGMGFSRAARLMEHLESQGIVGPARGEDSNARQILNLPAQPDGAGVSSPKDAAPTAGPSGPPVKSEKQLPEGMSVLREFYGRLQPTDHQLVPQGDSFVPISLLKKRGLTTATCVALGFRANPRSNEAILLELQQKHRWDELQASGLFLDADPERHLERRVNTQFCGKGQFGKKPEQDRRNHDDKWLWGWCEPVLIPYFDQAGNLVKLRPHKGGAPAGTIAGAERLYVPRDPRKCPELVERFSTVVICEGEYKGAAIWQTLGLGAWANGEVKEAVGVCALPGISFVRNDAMLYELEFWLGAVGCRKVIVGFDDEDKSDKPFRQRFDAKIYARYLGITLAKNLRIVGLVANLPKAWRVNGKADWDGALATILNP